MFGQFAERMAAGADATAVTARQTLVSRIFSFNARSAASNGASTHLYRRHISGGAIAGTVVGVVVAATLLLFCLYPVVVGYFKRRSKSRKRHDAETAVGGGEGATAAAAAAGQQRASSSESEKNGDLERGNFDDKQVDPAAEAIQRYDSNLVTANFVAKFGEEYMPQDIEDNQPGVLQGTSADYYRTSIPSEAFGMVDRPEQEQDDLSKSPTPSRASSFGHNFRSMFRRTNSKEHDVEEMAIAAQQRSLKKEDTLTESPIENTYPTPPAAPIAPLTRAMIISPAPATEASPPQSPPDSERRLRQSASPFHPAPGTVNPMDIMPASTQSEHWHRTEHQLFSTSHESPPPMGELMNQMPTSPPAQPLPEAEPSTFSPPAEDISWLEPDDTVYEQIVNEGLEKHYLSADGAGLSDPQNGLSPDWMSPPPAAASTDISSSLTPLSQPEVTSPESIAASNGRPSASPLALPQHAGSPEALGNFQCAQPGCTQSFDQKHKLKHHQRYHAKDHKCTYPGCDMGFGTKTHLQRHINDRHEKKKKFHCSVEGCDYSRMGGKAFPRKDNWKRHMTKIHQLDQKQLPEPVEIDVEMTGV